MSNQKKLKRKKPNLASKSLLRLMYHFYAKRHFTKFIKLTIDGDINSLPMPCVVIGNHCSFADVVGSAYILQKRKKPSAPSFIASQTQYANFGKILNKLGVLPKKQFTVDTSLIRDIKYVLDKGRPVILFPEAKLSVDGTPCIIKPGIAKLIKLLKVPLVTMKFDGSYLYKPRWSEHKNKVPVKATVKCIVTADEIATLSVEDIFTRLIDNLQYDDYKYQRENKIRIDAENRAEGLHSLLFCCPQCGERYTMTSQKHILHCTNCDARFSMDEYGVLSGGRFDSVPQWYKWQCETIAEEIKTDDYKVEQECIVTVLDKTKFVELGKGKLTLDSQGLMLTKPDGLQFYKRGTFYTLSFDGNAVFLPTNDKVYKLLMPDNGITTTFNIAVEQYGFADEQNLHKEQNEK